MIKKDNILFENKQTYLLYNAIGHSGRAEFQLNNAEKITEDDMKEIIDEINYRDNLVFVPCYNFDKWI